MGEKRYTTDEVAEIYRVARCTVYRWMREGKLHGQLFGRAYLFTSSDLNSFEEACANGNSVPNAR